MHPTETRIYASVLAGLSVLALVIVYFVVTIVRYQQKKVTPRSERLHIEIKSVEEERERIARDLHDDLGSTLYAVKLKLSAMEPPTADEQLLVSQSEKYLEEAFVRLKGISLNLTPQVLQTKGLQVALNEMLPRLLVPAGIKFSSHYGIGFFAKNEAIHVYRIVQEIVTNIVKHAAATKVSVSIEMKDSKTIQLYISDNGAGFNKRTVIQNKTGRGLQNITARVRMLHAKMYLTTAPGKGTEYLVHIPYTHDID